MLLALRTGVGDFRRPQATAAMPKPKMARVLGKSDDERRYALLVSLVRAAFAAEFLSPNGLMTSDAQTAYSLALVVDLIPTPASGKPRAVNRYPVLPSVPFFYAPMSYGASGIAPK